MTASTTRSLLDQVQQFHQQVADYCARTARLSQDERIRLLLDYIGRHEQHLAEATAHYAADGSDKVLNTWFRNPPTPLTGTSIDTLGTNPDVSDVIKWVIRIDDSIIAYYQSLAAEAEIPEVKTVLNNLLTMENREKLKTVRSALRIDDL